MAPSLAGALLWLPSWCWVSLQLPPQGTHRVCPGHYQCWALAKHPNWPCCILHTLASLMWMSSAENQINSFLLFSSPWYYLCLWCAFWARYFCFTALLSLCFGAESLVIKDPVALCEKSALKPSFEVGQDGIYLCPVHGALWGTGHSQILLLCMSLMLKSHFLWYWSCLLLLPL